MTHWNYYLFPSTLLIEHLPTVAEADDRRDFPQVPQAPHLLPLDEESVACKNKNITTLSNIHVIQRQEETQKPVGQLSPVHNKWWQIGLLWKRK